MRYIYGFFPIKFHKKISKYRPAVCDVMNNIIQSHLNSIILKFQSHKLLFEDEERVVEKKLEIGQNCVHTDRRCPQPFFFLSSLLYTFVSSRDSLPDQLGYQISHENDSHKVCALQQ